MGRGCLKDRLQFPINRIFAGTARFGFLIPSRTHTIVSHFDVDRPKQRAGAEIRFCQSVGFISKRHSIFATPKITQGTTRCCQKS